MGNGRSRRASGEQYRVERFVARKNGSLKVWRWEAPTYRTGNFGFRLVRVDAASREVLTEVRYDSVTRTNAYPFTEFQADVMKALRRLRGDLQKTPLGYSHDQRVTADGMDEVRLVRRELSQEAGVATSRELTHAVPSRWSCPGIKTTVLKSERFDPEQDTGPIAQYLSDVAAEALELNRQARRAAQQQAQLERETAERERAQAEAVARKRAAAQRLKVTLDEALKDFNVHDVS